VLLICATTWNDQVDQFQDMIQVRASRQLYCFFVGWFGFAAKQDLGTLWAEVMLMNPCFDFV
jgi:hypothetical protein